MEAIHNTVLISDHEWLYCPSRISVLQSHKVPLAWLHSADKPNEAEKEIMRFDEENSQDR
jgi:hypothetical protein